MEGGSAAAFVEQKWHGLLNLLEGRGGGEGWGSNVELSLRLETAPRANSRWDDSKLNNVLSRRL